MTYFEPKTFELQSENQPWSYATDGVTQRFEVRSGDNWLWDGLAKERSEIASYKKLAFGQTYTINYKFMVEPGLKNSADWLLIGQVHQTEDPGEIGLSPPLAIEMLGERLRIVARSNPEAMSTWAGTTTKTLWTDTADLERGRWYDMKLEVRFDPFGGGLLNVWRDGQKIVSYAGAIGYNDQVGGYWKHGVYREASPETFATKFSDLSIVEGTTAAPVVSPADDATTPASRPVPVNPAPSSSETDGPDTPTGASNADRGGSGTGQLVGGPGNDTINATASYTLADHVKNLMLLGTAAIHGTGNALDNTINGNEAANTIDGGAGDDKLRGNGGNDTIHGGSGDDYISGGADNDVLSGGPGSDRIYGGTGADVFRFGTLADLGPVTSMDRIDDFSAAQGDRIDLSSIDADPRIAGDQDFTFIGSGAFTGAAGELREVRVNATQRRVEGDLDGDRAADFQFLVTTSMALTAGDFLL